MRAVEGSDRIPGVMLGEHRLTGRRVRDRDRPWALAFTPDLGHAANPRAPTAAAADDLACATHAAAAVPFEDDEWRTRCSSPRARMRTRFARPVRRALAGRRPGAWPFASVRGPRRRSAPFLGYLPFGTTDTVMARATILLQRGRPNDFNRLRLPAKLQSYLASGRPTITFAVGLGELLEDRDEVLKTTGQPGELADRIGELLEDADLHDRLSIGGPRAARGLFDEEANVAALVSHYRGALAGEPRP